MIGRKNWLFENSVNGTKTSQVIYSIVETAKLNNLNVEKYLTYLFDNCELIGDEKRVLEVLQQMKI